MRFEIKIECDNFAFDASPTEEVARILKIHALRLENDGLQRSVGLYDINGNRIGAAVWIGKFK